MHIEDLQDICKKLPAVEEDIKWGNDLCFCVGKKMFLVVGLGRTPASASFKVKDEEFDEMCIRKGFAPAAYVARYKWVSTRDLNNMNKKDWEHYVKQSYALVKEKLPKKIKKELGLA